MLETFLKNPAYKMWQFWAGIILWLSIALFFQRELDYPKWINYACSFIFGCMWNGIFSRMTVEDNITVIPNEESLRRMNDENARKAFKAFTREK